MMMRKIIGRFIYWAPRILSILFICFLALFSLDIFDMKLDFWGTVLGLFMHNIPSLVLLVVVLISWKHELVGAIAFTLAGMLYIALTIGRAVPWPMAMIWSLTIAGPAFLVGILFFVNWRQRRK